MGPIKLKKLLEQYSSIEKVCEVISAPIEKAQEIIQKAQNDQIKIIDQENELYPQALKQIYDAPPVLYIVGDETLLSYPQLIAMVGTRKATHYGSEIAKKLAQDLVGLGYVIVSGLATGIDTFSHQGALANKGKTIAVLGCGVDVVYPKSNKQLYEEIREQGAIVSEFPPGTEPQVYMFPQRNRIISGLSLGVIIVEGGYESGAMITAKIALDQNREVFAVPGNIGSELSKGPHWLIKQGAKLIEGVEDILDELNNQIPNTKVQGIFNNQISIDLSEDEKMVVKALSVEPKHIDNICLEVQLPLPQVSGLLMGLEIKQAIKQLPGKRFVLQ